MTQDASKDQDEPATPEPEQQSQGVARTGAGADAAFEAMVKKRRTRPGGDATTEPPQPAADDGSGASDS